MSEVPRWKAGRPIIPVASLGQCVALTEWLALGPFRLDENLYREQEIGRADAVESDPLGGETTVRPILGMEHKNPDLVAGVCRWEKLSGSASYDLQARYPQFDTAIAYAATYLVTDTAVDCALWVTGMCEYRASTVQVLLDGVEVGRAEEVFGVHLTEGEHCLLLKISGGAHRRYAWQIDVFGGVVRALDDCIGAALVRLPGLWRGRPGDLRAVVHLVLVNRTDESACAEGVRTRFEGQSAGAPVRVTLGPREARSLRLEAPLGTLEPGTKSQLTVVQSARELSTTVMIPQPPAPGIIHVVEGFHCDPVWVSDQHHYNLVSMENVRQLLDGCLADPNYRAFLHEIDYLKPFVDEYPDYRAALFGLIQRGQVHLGSSYNEPNENNCSGEAIIRNILYGYGFHRKFLGGEPGVYHAWDVFGHIPQLSQIAAKSGLIGVLWSKPVVGFPPVFRHLALDGTALPHVRTLYGWGTHSLDRLISSTASLLEEKLSFGIRRHLVVDAGDFTSPSAWMIGRTTEMARSYPPVTMTGPEDFLRGLTQDGARLRLTSRSPSQYHVGTTHSRPEMKIANRMGENLLVSAEKWATFAALMGAEYPDLALDKAWRLLLFAQHHDALSGTPCDVSYLDLMAGYREALELGSDVVGRATAFIAEAAKRPRDGASVIVFNSLNWPRRGMVSVPKPLDAEDVEVRSADGHAVPCILDGERLTFLAPEVRSVGYTTVTVRPMVRGEGSGSKGAPRAARSETGAPPSNPCLENEFWKIMLDPARGGGIASLTDKRTGRELIDGSIGVGNDLVALHERGVRGGSPWEFRTTGARHHASQWSAEVRIDSTPVGETASIAGRLADICSYRRTVTLRPGQRTIEASVVIAGYRRDDHLFVVATPLALGGSLPVVEDRFGSIATKRNRFKFDYRTGGNTKHSDCVVFPVYNWLEAGWSARVDAGSNSSLNLGLTGLIIPHDEALETAIEPLMTAFAHAGVTCTPMYDDDDMPRRRPLEDRFQEPGSEKTKLENTVWNRLDDLNMTNNWVAVSVAGSNSYVNELLKRLPRRATRKLNEMERERGWAMIVAEDGNVPGGWDPVPVVILTATSHEMLLRAVAQIGEQLAADGRVRLPEGSDFRATPGGVDDYGFAVLTNGTGGAALEPDGMLTLMLTKSAPWADMHLRAFVPEHRTMVFRYGFYPHAGSWREADVVQAGYEFDNPLTAVAPTGRGGTLPPTHAFLSFDASDAVISAIKPRGNPTVCFESRTSDPRNGIVVRAYNANGRGSRGGLRIAAGIAQARAVDLMEEDRGGVPVKDGEVEWSLGPYSVETIMLVPDIASLTGVRVPQGESPKLGRQTEPVQPVYCRYWKHNADAHPIGYLPVGIYITGELPIENVGGNFPTVGRIRVTINNNVTDREISGTAQLIAPEGWTLIPSEIPYRLHPREHATTEIVVACEKYRRTGLIKARMEYGGQLYQDVLEAGRKTEVKIGGGGSVRLNRMDVVKEREAEWGVFRDGHDIVVRVRNPWWQPLDSELAVITPPEMWGEVVGGYGLAEVTPRNVGLTIPARRTATVRFVIRASGEKNVTFWAWVKLMCNGKPGYRPVPGTTA